MAGAEPRDLGELGAVLAGDRLFVRCEGGPCVSRLVASPPPSEIDERGGLYVLDDDGPPEEWVYFFVPTKAE